VKQPGKQVTEPNSDSKTFAMWCEMMDYLELASGDSVVGVFET
jgi:hypothetical protein